MIGRAQQKIEDVPFTLFGELKKESQHIPVLKWLHVNIINLSFLPSGS